MSVRVTLDLPLGHTATGAQTSTVGEPSVAASWTGYVLTGNWYATSSPDAGASWRFVNPYTQFPPAAGGFCCDQVVRYSHEHRLWVWLLQYQERDGSNIARVAVSRSGEAGTWRHWDVAPSDVDPGWSRLWFDYPDMALSAEHLWISFNLYTPTGSWRRAVVMRFPLDEAAELERSGAGTISRQSWSTGAHGSLRFVTGAHDTMWWASTTSAAGRLTVFAWEDASPDIRSWLVEVSPWDDRDYTSLGPGGAPWLSRVDDRITGGWRLPAQDSSPRAPARLGWLWTSGRRAGRPHPFIRAVTLAEDDLRVLAEPDLWSTSAAWAYPAAAPSGRGRIGLAACFGGGASHPALVVGMLDEVVGSWSTTRVATSTHGPSQGKWGDYLTVQPHPRRPTSLVAAGFTLQGGSDRTNVEPRVVVFRD
jgi:hypothetical protein